MMPLSVVALLSCFPVASAESDSHVSMLQHSLTGRSTTHGKAALPSCEDGFQISKPTFECNTSYFTFKKKSTRIRYSKVCTEGGTPVDMQIQINMNYCDGEGYKFTHNNWAMLDLDLRTGKAEREDWTNSPARSMVVSFFKTGTSESIKLKKVHINFYENGGNRLLAGNWSTMTSWFGEMSKPYEGRCNQIRMRCNKNNCNYREPPDVMDGKEPKDFNTILQLKYEMTSSSFFLLNGVDAVRRNSKLFITAGKPLQGTKQTSKYGCKSSTYPPPKNLKFPRNPDATKAPVPTEKLPLCKDNLSLRDAKVECEIGHLGFDKRHSRVRFPNVCLEQGKAVDLEVRVNHIICFYDENHAWVRDRGGGKRAGLEVAWDFVRFVFNSQYVDNAYVPGGRWYSNTFGGNELLFVFLEAGTDKEIKLQEVNLVLLPHEGDLGLKKSSLQILGTNHSSITVNTEGTWKPIEPKVETLKGVPVKGVNIPWYGKASTADRNYPFRGEIKEFFREKEMRGYPSPLLYRCYAVQVKYKMLSQMSMQIYSNHHTGFWLAGMRALKGGKWKTVENADAPTPAPTPPPTPPTPLPTPAPTAPVAPGKPCCCNHTS